MYLVELDYLIIDAQEILVHVSNNKAIILLLNFTKITQTGLFFR